MPSLVSRAAWLVVLCLSVTAPALADTCPAPGEWQRPDDGSRPTAPELFDELARQDVVMLGEQHDNADHHRWQLHTLAGLHARRPELVIGMEMLPREAQPALDAWVAGELDEAEFLARSEWHRAWGYDPDLYWPILHFARLHRIPVKAINITPQLRRRLVDETWSAIPLDERHRITVPARPDEKYRETLARFYAQHPTGDDDDGLARFVTAQLAWDRAMATGLVEAGENGALVVGLMGEGHLRFGHGVPHQLRDLGIEAQQALLPWSVHEGGCEAPPKGLAQAVFAITETPARASPRMLGVALVPHEDGVEIHRVVEDSVAEAAGLVAGDVILRVAGEPVSRPDEVSRHVRRQPPGTLLPLDVRRSGETQEILARFPSSAG